MYLPQFFQFLFIGLLSLNVSAHGEDQPGPNGGHIRMPSNFHTEIVAVSDTEFKLYLLDIQFKNPTVTDSQVQVQVKSGSKKRNALCDVKADHFACRLPNKYKKGQLIVKAVRSGVSGADALYDWPLKEFKAAQSSAPKAQPSSNKGHEHHH